MRVLLRSCSLAPVLLCMVFVSVSPADVDEIVWGETEIVAAGSPVPSGASGSSAQHTPPSAHWSNLNQWHVVYEESGGVYHAIRDDSGWREPEAMGTPGPARGPKLAFGNTHLHLVWEEDDRSGKPEIWTRRWDPEGWLPPVCLTQDQSPSRMPVIARGPDGVYLAWQEGGDGTRSVVGKYWGLNDSEWGPTEAISMSSREAMEPSVAITPDEQVHVAWTDTRSFIKEIYLRTRDEFGVWQEEIPMTDLPGDCERPSLYAENDRIMPWDAEMMLVFENDQTGTPEVYGLCYRPQSVPPEPIPISPADDVPSTRPNIHGFAFTFLSDFHESLYGKYLLAYTDGIVPGSMEHVAVFFGSCGLDHSQEIVATSGARWMLASAAEGSPDAELMILWTEEIDRTEQLLSRTGEVAGCFYPRVLAPNSILLGPEGVPENVISTVDACDGDAPIEGWPVDLRFSADLDEELTWDPGQAHPDLPPVDTGHNGEAAFPIYGGGCSQLGEVLIRVNGVVVWSVPGAKSPDVDGDCLVELEDLIYVDSRVGTDDFCADLDGNGTVDVEDLLIVESALGDFCLSLVGVEDGLPVAAGGTSMSIRPNPSRGRAAISFGLRDRTETSLRIYDAAGRLVADFGTRKQRPGSSGFLWDGRDQAGRPVGAGVYFAVGRVAGQVMRRPLILVR